MIIEGGFAAGARMRRPFDRKSDFRLSCLANIGGRCAQALGIIK